MLHHLGKCSSGVCHDIAAKLEAEVRRRNGAEELIPVNREALQRLLAGSEGFWEMDLGVSWADDGSGFARRLISGSLPSRDENDG